MYVTRSIRERKNLYKKSLLRVFQWPSINIVVLNTEIIDSHGERAHNNHFDSLYHSVYKYCQREINEFA